MARTLCIPGTVLLLATLILSVLVSISLPFLPGLDIARVSTTNAVGLTSTLRLGIWTSCVFSSSGAHACNANALGYEIAVFNIVNNEVDIVTSAWTRGLVLHPIATVFILIASITSLFTSFTFSLVAFLATSFATLITLIAFIIDLTFFVHVRNVVKNAAIVGDTNTAPGFWLSFVSVVFLILASITFFLGRRRESISNQTSNYPMQSPKSGRFQWTDKFQNI